MPLTHPGKNRLSLVLIAFASFLAQPAIRAQQGAPSESAKRDAWQRPAEVMDTLEIKPGSAVADVGCGDGYFTFHFAERVGSNGKVYAEDIDYKVLSKISARAFKEKIGQIELVQGSESDPRLPAAALDAILVVNAYHEMDKYDDMLQAMSRALRPGGLLGIIDRKARPGKTHPQYHERHQIPEELVRQDVERNGFLFLRKERGFTNPDRNRKFYFLVFQKPAA